MSKTGRSATECTFVCCFAYIYSFKIIHKELPPELLFLTRVCNISFVGWDFSPDPTGALLPVSLQVAADPLSVL